MSIYIMLNYTGRKFMCIGRKESDDSVQYWSDNFTIGHDYHECLRDTIGKNRTKEFDGMILLYGNDKKPTYADIRMFKRIEDEKTILLGKLICLN